MLDTHTATTVPIARHSSLPPAAPKARQPQAFALQLATAHANTQVPPANTTELIEQGQQDDSPEPNYLPFDGPYQPPPRSTHSQAKIRRKHKQQG